MTLPAVADGQHAIVIVHETAFVSCAMLPRLATRITQRSVGLGRLGHSRAEYERAYWPLSRVDRIERSLSVLVFGRAEVSVYMRSGKGLALSTAGREYRTREAVGPCSSFSDLRRAYGKRLRLVLAHRLVRLYTVGDVVFRVAGGRVGSVTVGKGALARQVAGNSIDCGAR